MSNVKYTYSIVNDTVNGTVVSNKLSSEIQRSDITIALDRIDTNGDILDIWFKSTLLDNQEEILDLIVSNHDGVWINDVMTNADGVEQVEVVPRKMKSTDVETRIVTHDFSDKTTWYQHSTLKTGQVLTNTGDDLTYEYSGSLKPWINYKSKKITNKQYGLLKKDGTFGNVWEFKYIIYKNGTEVSETDYTISDFGVTNNVSITFNSANSSSDVITADFYYVDPEKNSSLFEMRCEVGKKIVLISSEIQCSKTITFPSTLVFEVWAGDNQATYDYFFGQDMNPTTNPCLQYKMEYRSLIDFINDSAVGKNTIPLEGHPDFPSGDVVEFPFLYDQVIELPATGTSPYGNMVLRVYMKDDIPFENTDIATGTFRAFYSILV